MWEFYKNLKYLQYFFKYFIIFPLYVSVAKFIQIKDTWE